MLTQLLLSSSILISALHQLPAASEFMFLAAHCQILSDHRTGPIISERGFSVVVVEGNPLEFDVFGE